MNTDVAKKNPQERHSLGGKENRSAESTADSFSQSANQSNGTEHAGSQERPHSLHAFASEALALGFSILPTIPGEKRPAVKNWKVYQRRLPTAEEHGGWFSSSEQQGLGVVCGEVSGNLECLDFDAPESFDLYRELAERTGLGDLIERVVNGYCERTPGGYHLLWRCSAIAGNTKLAMSYERDEDGEVRHDLKGQPCLKCQVETRGEGGWVIIAPSYGNTHPSGKPYMQVSGGLATIETITPEERELLLDLARSLSEAVEQPKAEQRAHSRYKTSDGSRPGDLFNQHASWGEILVPHGWTAVFERSGVTHWRRPGKSIGTSATTNFADTNLLYVFSSSSGFESARGYSKFSAHALLNFDSDFKKAANDLARQGYVPRGDAAEAGEAEPKQEGTGGAETSRSTQPTVRITTDLAGMVDEAERHLMALPGPVLYQRARLLCRIAPAGHSSPWLQRPPDAPIIVRAETVSLREESGRAVQWVRLDKREKAWVLALPPTVVFETLAARLAWKFPYLEGILHAPTLRPDGKLITTQGYDTETGLFLDFNGVQFSPVPETPTDAEICAARDLLRTPFMDFPFTAPHHEAAAIAATLTVIARFAIPGCIPAFPVRSHAKGSGKGLLVNTIATIGTGRTAPTWTQTLDPAEEGKRLLSIALAGDAVMHIDNVVYPFGSDKLDSAITTSTIKDRLLGTNTNQEAPWLTVVFSSGNNMTFRGDTVRRVVPIDLDPKVERPEERGGFQHSPLLEWVHAQRPQLVAAGLTLLKAFCHAGRPKQDNIPEFGSFEQWASLIRHGVVWCGFPDPCEGRKTLEAESDIGYEAIATLLHCWGECYPDTKGHTLKTVVQDVEQRKTPNPDAVTPANEWNALHDALSAYDDKYDGKRLDTKRIGNALRTIEGRIVGNHRLIKEGEYNHAALWKRKITGA